MFLNREEITEDNLHMWSKYVRLKVLTEAGKDFAPNVELRQYHETDGGGYTVGEVEGRTIHADGTVIPFTGKPYEKLVQRSQGSKTMAKVFTLPDVQVGSILEYRYKLRYDDNRFLAPSWYVQSELYTRKAHYLWKPTSESLVTSDAGGGQRTNSIAWTPILPAGAEIKQSRLPKQGMQADGQVVMELNVHDIPPAPEEEYMPPIGSLSYRVLFYYSPYQSPQEFWKNEGKRWAKESDRFVGPGPKVNAAVRDLVAGSATQDEKLRKIYEAVMTLDNTAYSRKASANEDKSQGLGLAKTTDDVWERKRGTDDQMAQLFVAMARAAGMKAYVMAVTDRDRNLFIPAYMSMSQLDDYVAIVNVDGKERFFDPGERYCPYGHLAWKHTLAHGLRQTEGATGLDETPTEPYSASKTQRVANLDMDAHGEVTGTVKMVWMGSPALQWRQVALRGDNASLQRELRVAMEKMLPGGMEVTLGQIDNLNDYEKPFGVAYNVKGTLGSATGKRLLMPTEIFETNTKARFPHEKRSLAVYYEYQFTMQDAVRVNFPASFTVESLPASEKIPFQKSAQYVFSSDSTPTSITVHRDFVLGTIGYPASDYPELRAFYGKFETKDQEAAVLKIVAPGGE